MAFSAVSQVAAANAYVTPIAAFVGAILVALIAAVTAERRLTKQLQAEHERQCAQLDQDRELADLSDLRQLLDEAVRALRSIDYQYAEPVSSGDTQAIEDRGRQQRLLDALAARLHVRLGPEDEITIAFAHAHSAARQLAEPAPKTNRAGGPDARQALTLGIDDVVSASVQRAGAFGTTRNGKP